MLICFDFGGFEFSNFATAKIHHFSGFAPKLRNSRIAGHLLPFKESFSVFSHFRIKSLALIIVEISCKGSSPLSIVFSIEIASNRSFSMCPFLGILFSLSKQ